MKIDLGAIATTLKGEYDENTQYKELEIVSKEGSSYACKKDCKGIDVTNTEYWQLLAEKGTDGIIGKDGKDGVNGKDGKDFKYEDFTPEQLEDLKGEKGEKGEKGDAFTYEDFTAEQLESLKGERGEQGEQGEKGEDGKTPIKGLDYYTEAEKETFVAEITEEVKKEQSEFEEKYNERLTDVELNTVLNTAEGTELELKDSAEGYIRNIKIKGQESVTGENTITLQNKNVFDTNNLVYASNQNCAAQFLSENNVKITNNGNGTWCRAIYTLTGLKPSTNYTISAEITSTGDTKFGFYINSTFINNKTDITGKIRYYYTFTTSEERTKQIGFYTNYSGTKNNDTVYYNNIQLEEGNTVTEFTAYNKQKYTLSLGDITMSEGNYIFKQDDKYYLYNNENDIEITDETLVSQLDNLYKNARTYKDVTYINSVVESENEKTILEITYNVNLNTIRGEKGEKGDAFTYEDFTQEQLQALKGKDGTNGKDGVDGKDGKDGKTPVKGVDYLTETEVNTIVQDITTQVDNNIGLAIDEISGEEV